MDIKIVTLAFGILVALLSSGHSQDYTTISPPWDCGNHLHSDFGYFKSPNYPSNYPNNLDCIWRITTSSPGIFVNIDSGVFLQFCGEYTCDFLEIRDGPDSSSPLLVRITGNNDAYPGKYIAYSDNLWIRFRTDRSGTETGFALDFMIVAYWTGTGTPTTAQTWTTTTASTTPKSTTKSPPPGSGGNQPGVIINNNNNMFVNFFDWSKFWPWFNRPSTTSTTTQQPQIDTPPTTSAW